MNNRHYPSLLLLLFLSISLFAQKPGLGIPVGHSERIFSVAFSPDGKYAASASEDKSIKLWQLSDGKLLKNWEPYRDDLDVTPIFGAEFALNGKFLLCGAGQIGEPLQALEFAKKDTAGAVRIFRDPAIVPIGAQPSVRAICVSPSGNDVLTLSADNDLKLWSVESGQLLFVFEKQQEKTASICFSPDCRWVFSGHRDGSVRQWDAATGKPVALFKNVHAAEVTTLAVSPDGLRALSGTEQGPLKLWQPEGGKAVVIQEFAQTYSPGQTAVFSPDGKRIAYGTNNSTIVFWDTEKKLPIDTLKGHARQVTALRFSPDGQMLLSGSFDKSVILWNVATGEKALVLNGYSKMLKQLFFTPSKKFACVVPEFSNEIVVWNTETGGVQGYFAGHENAVITACVSPKGKYLLSSADDKQVLLWDFETQKKIGSLDGQKDYVTCLAISPDEQLALTGSEDKSLTLWDLNTRKPLKTFTGHTSKVTAVAFSPDGKQAMSAADDNTVRVYDVEKRSLVSDIKGQANRWPPVAFSPDGTSFLSISCETARVEWWDIATKKIKKVFSLKYDVDDPAAKIYCGTPSRAAFSPDGQRFLLSSGYDVLLWDVSGDKPVFLRGHVGFVKSVAFSPDGEVAVSAGYDGSVRLWNGKTGEALCTVFHLNSHDWVAITPSGLFDASPGAMQTMYFTLGLETIELEQLKDRYYEPDLLPILMGFKKGSLRNVATLDNLELYPKLNAKLKGNDLAINLLARNGGLGKVSVFINGTEVLEDACKGLADCTVDLADYKNHFFSADSAKANNTITLRAFNQEGWLKSPELVLYPFSKASRGDDSGDDDFDISFGPAPDPSLYLVVVGTSDYAGNSIDLGFPDKDAKAIAKAMKTIAEGTELFQDRVFVSQLTTDATDAKSLPSKKNIEAVFQNIAKKAKAEDVLMIFLSGHGVTNAASGKDEFYYLTKDVAGIKLDAADVRNNFCISTDTLGAWISAIPAKKRVVILDACHSGKAAQSLTLSRAPLSSQKRELERLKDRTGMFVLAASQSDQKSWEDFQLQQGLLTYSLLFGLDSRKGVMPSGAVDVQGLFQFARDYVPQLASGINEDQTPVLTVPDKEASSFSIGWVAGATKIEMGRKARFLVQSTFLNKEGGGDNLKLGFALNERLEAGGLPGGLGQLVFANTSQMNDAYAINGLYTIKDGKVRLEGGLSVPGEVAKPFVIEGFPAGDLAGLVEQVLEAVNVKLE